MTRRRAALGLLVLTMVAAGSLIAADDLTTRVERLVQEGRYDLALGILDDHQQRGVALDRTLQWTRAQLVPDADRFDRLAAELVGGQSAADSSVQSMVYARAREQFARGQYLTCLDNLRALPPEAALRHPDLVLFEAMAAQAAGEAGPARRLLEGVAAGHRHYAEAQTLLADLTLRAGQPQRALEYVSRALKARPHRAGAQANYLAWQAHRQLGDLDRAQVARDTLLRDFPRSVEAAWVVESRATSTVAQADDSIVEVEAPPRRADFALQLGAFRDRSLALRLAAEHRGVVTELRVERDLSTTPPWYRVVGGKYPTRGQAEAAQSGLRERGVDAVILAPGRSGP